ncbi:MAG TPA: hypothetical protein DCQ90_03060 [Erysipelotrichaceae bacterium]|nr:hypothetical protein [Erysipelotrichaceae bacterium]
MKRSEKILANRKRLNLSQEELSEKLNVSRQAVSKWESDQANPDIDKIIAMAQLFGISVDELVSENYEPRASQPVQERIEVKPMPVVVKSRKEKSWMILSGLIVFALFLFYIVGRYEARLSYLENQLNGLNMSIGRIQSDVQLSVSGLIQQLRDELVYQNGIIAEYSVKKTTIDLEEEKVTYSVSFLLKKTDQLYDVGITISNSEGYNQNLELKKDAGGYFKAEFDYPMNQTDFKVNVNLEKDGVVETQSLGSYSGYGHLLHQTVFADPTSYTYDSMGNEKKDQLTLMNGMWVGFNGYYPQGQNPNRLKYALRIYEEGKTAPALTLMFDFNDQDCINEQELGICYSDVGRLVEFDDFKLDFDVGDVITFTLSKNDGNILTDEKTVYTLTRVSQSEVRDERIEYTE